MIPRRSRADVLARDADTLLVDPAPPELFTRVHIAGASSVPLATIDAQVAGRLDPTVPVIVVAASPLCPTGPRAAARLAALGYDVALYAGGTAEWAAWGHPTDGEADLVAAHIEPVRTAPIDAVAGPPGEPTPDRESGPLVLVDEHDMASGTVDVTALAALTPGALVAAAAEADPPVVSAADELGAVRGVIAQRGWALVLTPDATLLGVTRLPPD